MMFAKTKKDKLALKKMVISFLILAFAFIFWTWLKDSNEFRTAVFVPLLETNFWISGITLILWFLLLFKYQTMKKSSRKWKMYYGYSKKQIYNVAFTIFSFMFVFALLNSAWFWLRDNTSINDVINLFLNLDFISGIFVFAIAFVLILIIQKKWKIKRR